MAPAHMCHSIHTCDRIWGMPLLIGEGRAIDVLTSLYNHFKKKNTTCTTILLPYIKDSFDEGALQSFQLYIEYHNIQYWTFLYLIIKQIQFGQMQRPDMIVAITSIKI